MGHGSDEVFRDLLGLQEEIYRLFDESAARLGGQGEPCAARWTPPVDIHETGDRFVLTAEIPGLALDEIHLEIRPDLLTLRGERPLVRSASGLSYHRIERPNGSFQRSFRLPDAVDPDGARATYQDGVLEVLLPKRGRERRSVSVEIAD